MQDVNPECLQFSSKTFWQFDARMDCDFITRQMPRTKDFFGPIFLLIAGFDSITLAENKLSL